MFIRRFEREMKLEMVPVEKLVDAYSGVSMMDSTQTIMNGLTQLELDRYGKAVDKIEKGQILNVKDLKVLDKIDAITYEKHGMCLKDSYMTKARIKASKKYGIQFVDRDGLVNHMNQMRGLAVEKNSEELLNAKLHEQLGCFILDRLGDDRFIDFVNALASIMDKKVIGIEDIKVLSEVEYFTCKELGLSIFNEDIQKEIDKACMKYHFDFKSLSKKVIH